MAEHQKLIQVGVSALVALAFVNFYLKQKESNIESGFGMVDVVTAARDIPARTAINASYLTTKRVPQKYMEPGAIMVKIPALTFSKLENKVTVAPVPAGAQLMLSNLNDPSPTGTGVAPVIPRGKVGFLLRLGNLDVAELIVPTDYIDILATLNVKAKDGSQSKATYTILQNVMVVGVGRELVKPNQTQGGKTASESLVLTLALDPVEAERLSLAQSDSQGDITVVVRAHGDNQPRNLPGVMSSNLLDRGPASPPPVPH